MDCKKTHLSLELGRKLIELHPELKDWVEYKVPEIKENEDEMIREEIIQFLKLPHPQFVGKRDHEKWIDWLGNYKKENTSDNPKPKFKVGDWIMKQYVSTPFKVVGIDDNTYVLKCVDGNTYKESIEFTNSQYHLWTIEDAEDGDTLTYYLDNGKVLIFIYESLGESYDGQVNCHALLDGDYFSETVACVCCKFMEFLTPSTKEQHDLLYKKMQEKGYYFDEDEKILKGINKDKDETTVPVEDNSIKEELIKFLNNYINAHGCTEMSKWVSWIEKQGEKTNPYSGISFEYNGHTWGMCAREGSVDILCDSKLIKHIERNPSWNEDDEKVRKGLISMLSQDYELHKREIAWLEKQKEGNFNDNFPSFDEAQGTIVVEKQCEQKSVDNVESTAHSYITENSEFFQWIYDRLKYVYN